ncbi:hypothetical protein D9M68_522360 [compost metagenome]
MKKIKLMLLLLSIVAFSCKEKNQKIDVLALKEKVNKNENFIRYAKIQNEIINAGITQEVSFRNADRKMVSENISKVKSLLELKALYTEAGIIGAEKLATWQFESDQSLKGIFTDFPELEHVSREEMKVILDIDLKADEKKLKEHLKKLNPGKF